MVTRWRIVNEAKVRTSKRPLLFGTPQTLGQHTRVMHVLEMFVQGFVGSQSEIVTKIALVFVNRSGIQGSHLCHVVVRPLSIPW